jgi:MFS family permease
LSPIVPLILAVALFMEQMDSTVIATSLPAIAADLGTSPIALKLAVTAYLVALAIFIPVSGWMADRFGARASSGRRSASSSPDRSPAPSPARSRSSCWRGSCKGSAGR